MGLLDSYHASSSLSCVSRCLSQLLSKVATRFLHTLAVFRLLPPRWCWARCATSKCNNNVHISPTSREIDHWLEFPAAKINLGAHFLKILVLERKPDNFRRQYHYFYFSISSHAKAQLLKSGKMTRMSIFQRLEPGISRFYSGPKP